MWPSTIDSDVLCKRRVVTCSLLMHRTKKIQRWKRREKPTKGPIDFHELEITPSTLRPASLFSIFCALLGNVDRGTFDFFFRAIRQQQCLIKKILISYSDIKSSSRCAQDRKNRSFNLVYREKPRSAKAGFYLSMRSVSMKRIDLKLARDVVYAKPTIREPVKQPSEFSFQDRRRD